MFPINKKAWLRFFSIVKEHYASSELTSTSVIVAYYVLLSAFPLLILLGNVLGWVGIDPSLAMGYIEPLLPDPVEPYIEPVVYRLLTTTSGGFLSFSLLGLAWSASQGVRYLQNGMNKTYGVTSQASYLAKRIAAFVCIILMVLALGAFVLVFSFGDMILAFLAPVAEWAGPLRDTVHNFKWPVTLLFVFVLLLLLYVVVPAVKVRLRDALPGTAFAGLGLLVFVQLFAVYVRFAAKHITGYGTLSTFFVMMFWLNISVMLILAGSLLNACVQEYRFGEASVGENKIDILLEERLKPKVEKKWRERKQKNRQEDENKKD